MYKKLTKKKTIDTFRNDIKDNLEETERRELGFQSENCFFDYLQFNAFLMSPDSSIIPMQKIEEFYKFHSRYHFLISDESVKTITLLFSLINFFGNNMLLINSLILLTYDNRIDPMIFIHGIESNYQLILLNIPILLKLFARLSCKKSIRSQILGLIPSQILIPQIKPHNIHIISKILYKYSNLYCLGSSHFPYFFQFLQTVFQNYPKENNLSLQIILNLTKNSEFSYDMLNTFNIFPHFNFLLNSSNDISTISLIFQIFVVLLDSGFNELSKIDIHKAFDFLNCDSIIIQKHLLNFLISLTQVAVADGIVGIFDYFRDKNVLAIIYHNFSIGPSYEIKMLIIKLISNLVSFYGIAEISEFLVNEFIEEICLFSESLQTSDDAYALVSLLLKLMNSNSNEIVEAIKNYLSIESLMCICDDMDPIISLRVNTLIEELSQ